MIGYIPLNAEQLNVIQGGYTPSCIKAFNNKAFAFWQRALTQRAGSVIDFELPEEWTGSVKDFFYYVMLRFGYCVVYNDNERGLVFQPAALKGFDFYYQPTDAIISNPAYKASKELKIHKECEILKLQPDFMGTWDTISYFAEKLALLDNAINISLINNKYAWMLGAKNKAAGEALKKMLDKINSGEPAIVYDRKLANDPNDKSEPWQFWNRGNLRESYLTTDQLRDFQTILCDFDNEIGIPNLGAVEKKERMITDEANARKADAVSRSQLWIRTFNESAELVNAMFGTTISAKHNFDESGVIDNAE